MLIISVFVASFFAVWSALTTALSFVAMKLALAQGIPTEGLFETAVQFFLLTMTSLVGTIIFALMIKSPSRMAEEEPLEDARLCAP